jgi:hypothetical protein
MSTGQSTLGRPRPHHDLLLAGLAFYGASLTWLLCLTSRWISLNSSHAHPHDIKDHVALFTSEVFVFFYDFYFPHLLTAGFIGFAIWMCKRSVKTPTEGASNTP